LALNPQVIIIVGDITKVWDIIRSTVEEVSPFAQLKPPIRAGLLPTDQLYLQGAIYLALNKALAKPTLG
jgi:predicted NBD/HSP70 family sugar kinase